MTLFFSTFVNKIDKKGRLSVPAAFRATLTQISTFTGFAAFRSCKYSAIDCFSHERMVRLSDSIDRMDVFSNDQDDFAAAIFADVQLMCFDGEGRIVLTKSLIDHAGLTDQATFVGCGHTFQIWHPDTFKQIQLQARSRMKSNPVMVNIAKI